MRKIDKREFELHTRLLQVSSTETFSNGNYTEHYGYGRGYLVGWIRHKQDSQGNKTKEYYLISEKCK